MYIIHATSFLLSAVWGPPTHCGRHINMPPKGTWVLCGAMVVVIAMSFTLVKCTGTNNLHESGDSEEFTVINGLGVAFLFMGKG